MSKPSFPRGSSQRDSFPRDSFRRVSFRRDSFRRVSFRRDRRRAACAAAVASMIGLAAAITTGALATADPPVRAQSSLRAHAASHPSMVLTRRSPASIQGSGFRAHTRVKVTLKAGRRVSRRVRTDSAGTFTLTFRSMTVDRCSGYVMTASRNGTTLQVVRGPRPECAPM